MKREKGLTITKSVSHLLSGIAVLALGIVLLWKQIDFLELIMLLVSIVVAVGGAAHIIGWVFAKEKKGNNLLIGILSFLLGCIMFFFPIIPQAIVPILFAAYLLLNGAIKLVDTILIIRNKGKELLFSLLPALFFLGFGLIILFSPFAHMEIVLIIIGIYCILLGATYITDFVYSLIPEYTRQGFRRKIRVTLPIFLSAFIPHNVLDRLMKFHANGERSPREYEGLVGKKEDITPDLEIFIHVANDRFVMTVGHCDICFDGEMIAYGNYNDASASPIGTGDGVLLIDKKEDYIPFCLEFNKTTIFSFGLKLNEAQKEKIRTRLKEIKEETFPWEPPYRHDKETDPEGAAVKVYPDFSSNLARATNAKFYKFHSGKFKTYFVMSTNCVFFAEHLVCQAGTDILDINGIITPGVFYDYLEAEFLRKGSLVISRQVYSLDKNLHMKKKQKQKKAKDNTDSGSELVK